MSTGCRTAARGCRLLVPGPRITADSWSVCSFGAVSVPTASLRLLTARPGRPVPDEAVRTPGWTRTREVSPAMAGAWLPASPCRGAGRGARP